MQDNATGGARHAPQEYSNEEEHHEWASKMWARMDRDHSGAITRTELDCEEFRSTLKAVIAPNVGPSTGGVTYARAEMNIRQAMDFCLRKADLNNEGTLDFDEFKAFTRYLRQMTLAKHTCNLIFALFDLNGDNTIDKDEFREICRFYLGHNPTQVEFEAEWMRLCDGDQVVQRHHYIRWLQTSTNPVFRQHAPPEDEELPQVVRAQPAIKFKDRPGWNPNFNTRKNPNAELPQDRRHYFSRPQSLPELTRYYEKKRGHQKARKRMDVPTPRFEKSMICADTVPMIPSRHLPGGLMRSKSTHKVVPWRDFWQTPKACIQRYTPGTMYFQCPKLPPPELMRRHPDDDEDIGMPPGLG